MLASRKKIERLNRLARGIANRTGAKRTTTPANPPAVPQESKTKTETRTPHGRKFKSCRIPLGPIASVIRFRAIRVANPTMTQTRPDSKRYTFMRGVSLGKSCPWGWPEKGKPFGGFDFVMWTRGD